MSSVFSESTSGATSPLATCCHACPTVTASPVATACAARSGLIRRTAGSKGKRHLWPRPARCARLQMHG